MLRTQIILSMVLLISIAGCSSAPSATPLPTQTLLPTPTTTATATTVSKPASAVAPTLTVTSAPKQVMVEAWDDYFRPQNITITAGTKVTWVNVGQKKHNVAFGNLFDQDINLGDQFSFTFDKPGLVQYYCVQHSLSETEGMVGTIMVVAP